MCNDYRLKVDIDRIRQDWPDIRVRINFPEGVPNVQPRDDIKITDVAPIIRIGTEVGTVELVQRRWSWPAPNKKPVYNFRSEGRRFGDERCLILADGFYEFTAHTDPKSKRKQKWLFTLKDHDWFCIAGIWRTSPEAGEAFTMLTTEPGPDIAHITAGRWWCSGGRIGSGGSIRPCRRRTCCARSRQEACGSSR